MGQNFKNKNLALHHEIFCSKQFLGESHTLRLVRRKALRELLSHLMPSGRYLFIPYLSTKRFRPKIGQAKNCI